MFLSPTTMEKRRQLSLFIEQAVEPKSAIRALIGIGSIATGHSRPDSDIDLIAFLEPYDIYALPAEAIWRPEDQSFHSIFAHDVEGIQLDIARFDLSEWRKQDYIWPEERKAELVSGWLAYDRDSETSSLIAERCSYPTALQIARLDQAITWLDQHLSDDGPDTRWQSLGPILAHDRLNAAYTYLVQALFALNKTWQPWRNRELDALLSLAWLPQHCDQRILMALTAPGHDRRGYDARVAALLSLMSDVLSQAQAQYIYSDDPISEAFIRSHDEPGRAWNMDEWNAGRHE